MHHRQLVSTNTIIFKRDAGYVDTQSDSRRHFYNSPRFADPKRASRRRVASRPDRRVPAPDCRASKYLFFGAARELFFLLPLDNQAAARSYYRLSRRTLTSSIALSLAYTFAFVDLLLPLPPLPLLSPPLSLFLPLSLLSSSPADVA